MIEYREKQIFKTLGLSVILVANIFLFIPCLLYFGNLEEFSNPIWNLLTILFMFGLFIIGLLIAAGSIIRGESYRCYTVIIAVISFLFWLQGNVLVWEYGLLDGRDIDWTQKMWRGWIDLGIWISVITISIIFYRVVDKFITPLVVSIFSLQLIILIFTCIQNIDGLIDKTNSYNDPNVLNEMFSFSSEKNVLHIILDSYQADIFNEIINDKNDGQHYRSALDGFIFFQEHMGLFPTTYMSVPAILSGEIYHNHMPKKEFVKKVLSGDTILNTVSNVGYEVDIASNTFLIGMYTIGQYTNSYIIPDNYNFTKQMNTIDEALKLLDLSLFRLVPHFLKKYIYNDQRWLIRPLISDTELSGFPYFAHNAFLIDMMQKISVNRVKPTYKLFHLMSTHWPFVIDGSEGNCHYAGGALPIMRQPATWQMRCTLDVVIKLLDKMKEKGIYDNTLIIIMGDHGAQITPLRFKPQSKTEETGIYKFNLDAWIMAQATPLMMLKLPQAAGELQVSTAPTSMIDTAETINSILDLGENFTGRSMLDLDPAEQRERKHYFYHWTREDWESDYTAPIQEFIINGSIYDFEIWRLGKKFLSPIDAAASDPD